MKLAKIAVTFMAFLTSASVFAGALTGSSNVNFLALDGQKVRKSTVLQISDNQPHQVVVEVASIIGAGSGSSYFESNPIILTFNGNADGVQIVAPNLRNESDADQFEKSPKFQIKSQSGQEISYQWDYLKGEGFMPNASVESNLAQYNRSGGKAALAHLATASSAMMPANSTVAQGKVTVQGENIAEQQLQYWFQQADKATQKRFLEWAKKK